jgi:hypothetical protein
VHPIVIAVAVVGVLIATGIAVHLVLTWANRRGLVYYRNPERPPPRPLGLLEEVYQPSVTHAIEHEIEDATLAETKESGDPDIAGGPPS